MNPFDLSVTAFLALYVPFGAAVCAAMYWVSRWSEPALQAGQVPTDPCTIACLLGAPTEAIQSGGARFDRFHVLRHASRRSTRSAVKSFPGRPCPAGARPRQTVVAVAAMENCTGSNRKLLILNGEMSSG